MEKTESTTLDEAYRDRNLLAQLCAFYAQKAGVECCIDVSDKEWPILYIELPEGQISYHISLNDLTHFMTELPRVGPGHWDGHTMVEKQLTICRTLP